MKEIRVIYVSPGHAPPTTLWEQFTNWLHQLIGWPVQRVTRGCYAHTALLAVFRPERGEEILEAVAPKVGFFKPDKYDREPIRQVIAVPLTDEQHAAGVAAVMHEVGKWYGLDDCLIGGIRDLVTWIFGEAAGARAAAWAERVFDDRNSRDCSAIVTIYFQAALPGFMAGAEPCTVTPKVSRVAVLQLPGAKIVEGDDTH
jgi:hypothetical protein